MSHDFDPDCSTCLARDRVTNGETSRAAIRRLRARVSELEAEDARKQKMLDVCCVVHEHNVKLKTRIARARAELEQRGDPYVAITAAIAMLKGETTP